MNEYISEEIINKVLAKIATPKEQNLVITWFRTEEGQEYLSQRIDKDSLVEDYSTIYASDHAVPTSKIFKKIENQIFRKKILKFSKYAALIILPILVLGWGVLTLNSYVDILGNTEYVDVYVPKGKQVQVVFQDGSMAYLNSDTKLRYPKRFGVSNRKVELNGEAYFVIEKNPKRPFIVEIENVKVNVLGTSFNVEAFSSDKTISLILDEGKIDFATSIEDVKYGVKPGEKLVYNKLDGSCTISDNNTLISQGLWKDDIIYIEDEPLEDVLMKLDRKFDVRFNIQSREALKYRYTIMIAKNSSLNKVILDLERIAPVRFEKSGNTIFVKINKK